MPYVNRFKFEVRNISNDSELDLEYLKRKCGGFSWNNQSEDMMRYSSKNTGKLFIIERQGENKRDFSKNEYFNGEVVTGKIILTSEDQQEFIDKVLTPQLPNKVLEKAAKTYKDKSAA